MWFVVMCFAPGSMDGGVGMVWTEFMGAFELGRLHWQTNIIIWRAVHHVSIIDAGPTPEFRSRAPHFEVGACFHFRM